MLTRILGLLAALALAATASATTYTYTGLNYNFVAGGYTTAMSISGSFTTASPLPANMPVTDIGPNGSNLVTAWSFNDGQHTYTQANSVVMPQAGTFRIGTDATGSITSFYIQIEQPLPPHSVGQLINAITIANFTLTQSQGVSNAACLTLSGARCATLGAAPAYGDSTSSGSFAPVIQPPTLAEAFGAASVVVGGSTSLTFTVTNPNAGAALSGIGFSDTLPPGLVVATPNGLAGSCGGGTITAAAGSGTIALSGAALAGGANCTFAVNVAGTATGGQTNTTGSVTSTESGPGGTATASINVLPAPPPPPPPPAAAQPVPALETTALAALMLLLAGAGLVALRRQR